MLVQQLLWTESEGWTSTSRKQPDFSPGIILVFGGIDQINRPEIFHHLKSIFPGARIVMASTAGEIWGSHVSDNTVCATAISYASTSLEFVSAHIDDYGDSYQCGLHIRDQLLKKGLNHILVISDGIMVNGDQLVKGINENLPEGVVVTGGLAADAGRFTKTYVGLDAIPSEGNVVAIGHYGAHLKVSHGSKGGWDEFGPVRTVTRSLGNVLYELDSMNALELYKRYLGDRASELPGSALLFPLSIYGTDENTRLVRTILSIDEASGSMTFAGDIPTGARVQFMMANFDRLIDGANHAAEQSGVFGKNIKPDLILMISCVGRKIVLDQRIEEEVETVTDYFGLGPVYAGFYSNGEISPLLSNSSCSLHNQTMTITAYSENKTGE